MRSTPAWIRIDTDLAFDTLAPVPFQSRVRRFAKIVAEELRHLSIGSHGCASCGHANVTEHGRHPDTCRFARAMLDLGLAFEVEESMTTTPPLSSSTRV